MGWRRKILIALISAMAMPVAVFAQAADKAPAPAAPASQSAPAAELLKPEQLEALVAPIALYPDELLANVKNKMIGGFALIAWPADYGNSGVMTFLVNHAGTVYQKDLGKSTDFIAKRAMLFDPDQTWKKIDAAKP
jgi:hypothetical protein